METLLTREEILQQLIALDERVMVLEEELAKREAAILSAAERVA